LSTTLTAKPQGDDARDRENDIHAFFVF